MSPSERLTPLSLAVDIPNGYVGLPLDDIDRSIARTEAAFSHIGPGAVSSAAPAVLQALKVLLTRISQVNAVYCGLGRHASANGTLISSNLIVSLHEYSERKNPRLTLADILQARSNGTETFKNIELIEISGRQILMFDRMRTLPAPDLPDHSSAVLDEKVYQLEAIVPSSDGATIAAIEFSTSFVEYGEEFVPMIAAMAASVDFAPSVAQSSMPSSLDL
ncbi:hypothetical protein ACIA8C_26400 [Nocardia sp. NPDC051321]|uniref:hypothetical protein n=1 Tax=Nocardia sp. NPDC051321 TaxID=3364323 RepID=UPI00379B3E92